MSAPIILSHAVLEAAVCPAHLIDALKARHSVDGPMRGGQGFHTWIRIYLELLRKERRDMDVDAATRIWRDLVPFLSPTTEAFVGDAPLAFASTTLFDWLLKAEWAVIEKTYFLGMDRCCVNVGDLVAGGPYFRVTPDLMFFGEHHPTPNNRVVIPGGKLQHIVDWKLMWNIEHIDTPEHHRQLSRYAAALWDGVAEAVVVWLCFPRRGQWEAAVFYPDQLRAFWEELVVKPGRVIAAGALVDERVVSKHCLDCGLLNSCDAALRYPFIAAGVVDLDDEGLVTALGVVDHVKNQIEERLGSRLAVRGKDNPIVVDDRVVGVNETEKAVWDAATARAELKALQLSDDQVDVAFSVTLKGIERALADAQWKNPEKGGVKAKAKEISRKMPIIHGQQMDFGRRKASRQKLPDPLPQTLVDAFEAEKQRVYSEAGLNDIDAAGDDAVAGPVGDDE